MVHVSKTKLNPKVEAQLQKQIAELFVAHQTVKECTHLTREFFTKTERIMFAKRLGIIALLERGYSTYAISIAIGVSDSTVARIENQLEHGKFKNILKVLKNKRHRESVLGTIETLLTLGFPGVAGAKVRKQMRTDIESWRAGN